LAQLKFYGSMVELLNDLFINALSAGLLWYLLFTNWYSWL